MPSLFRFICFCIIFFYSFNSFAQTKIIVHENTTDGSTKKSNVKSDSKDALGRGAWAIKLNIVPCVRGNYCISIEKKVHKLFSIEATGGITYFDPIVDKLNRLITNNSFLGFLNYKPIDALYDQSKYNKITPMGRFAIRHYFNPDSDEDINGGYASLEVMFRRYRDNIPASMNNPIQNSIHATSLFNDHREIRGIIGWQGALENGAVFDFSFGSAYRMHAINYIGNKNTNQVMYDHKNYVTLVVNIKVGFSSN